MKSTVPEGAKKPIALLTDDGELSVARDTHAATIMRKIKAKPADRLHKHLRIVGFIVCTFLLFNLLARLVLALSSDLGLVIVVIGYGLWFFTVIFTSSYYLLNLFKLASPARPSWVVLFVRLPWMLMAGLIIYGSITFFLAVSCLMLLSSAGFNLAD